MRIRTRSKALRSAASVVFGRRGAGLAAAVALMVAGCSDAATGGSTNGVGAGDVTALADGATADDILADLTDLVMGADTGTPDAAAPDTAATDDAAAPLDIAGTDDAPAPVDVAAPEDTPTPLDVAADTAGPGDTGTAHGPDVASQDVADASGEDFGCLQLTGVPCSDAEPCPTDTVLTCYQGECAEMDITPNADAQACCDEKYAAGEFAAPGCNPWGPPAPPAFDRVAARRALRSLA